MKITRFSIARTGLSYVDFRALRGTPCSVLVHHRNPVVAEDSWGAEITSSTVAHRRFAKAGRPLPTDPGSASRPTSARSAIRSGVRVNAAEAHR